MSTHHSTGVVTENANRLLHEKSPYLLQHAYNPVDWLPWGEEAFQKARSGNKPIFLSIGYSTCHWCHVMAHESFEDPSIAELVNRWFVPIKVDREERPDVDKVYMTYVQATTGSGGWPLSVFLTPMLEPFIGGTYFPPEDKWGRVGFKTILTRIHEAWEKDPSGIQQAGTRAVEALKEHVNVDADPRSKPHPSLFRKAFDQLRSQFDPTFGGWGNAPKFPRPVNINLLLRVHSQKDWKPEEKNEVLGMTLFTLQKMAAGGMHDHLGGGFHRYSVDEEWHVPHFEKMLYDQGQLAVSYLEAYQITHEIHYQEVARDVLDYVRRDMTDSLGGFYSAEDADSLLEHGKPEHAEGAFYVWSHDEIRRHLGKGLAEIFIYHYGVEEQGNAQASDPHGEFTGKNVLIQRRSLTETADRFKKTELHIQKELKEARFELFQVRERRPRPHLDDKILTAWNGLMISAFAKAYQILHQEEYLDSAEKAAGFIRDHLSRDGQLLRSYRKGPGNIPGFAEDYVFLIQGLMDLYEASFDVSWLKWAIELQHRQDELFWDSEDGAYFSTTTQDASVLLRMKEDYDGAEPSPNSISALNLQRLAQMTGRAEWKDMADRILRLFAPRMELLPHAIPQMLVAYDFYSQPRMEVIIAGRKSSADTRALLEQVHEGFHPRKVLLLVDATESQKYLTTLVPFYGDVKMQDGKATAYLCENFACRQPMTNPADLKDLLVKV